MAGFQNFTPITADLAGVWRGFNPAANFLGGAKAVQQMDLDAAAEARLRELADTDRMVKETMLPLQVEEARANIALSMAGAEERAARARYIGVGGMKQLSARQQRYDAEIDPEGVQKGTQIIGTWNDAMGAAPMSSPSESTQTNYDNDSSGFQFNLGGDEDDFLGRISEDFPATNLNPERYAVSNDPKETTVGLSGGAMQAPQAGPAEVSQINALAKSGDEMASQFANPLSDKTPAETNNPLNDFEADPASAIQSTLDKNEGAFAGASKQQPQPKVSTLGDSITKFRNWERNAQRTIRQLDKSSPGGAQLATRAYNEQLGDFYADNFNGLDEDEINYLMKNPSKADRYIGYKEDFGPEEASWLSKINPSYADGVVRVFKDGKLPDGTSVVAESLEQSKMIYDNAIRQGMKPTPEENSAKRVQDRQVAMKNFLELKTAASENQEDKTLQAAYRLSLSDMKSVYGDEWDRVEFDLGQQEAADLIKYGGQPVRPDGKPTQGLEDKTASQVLAEKINSGGFIPVVKGAYNNGEIGFDDAELAKQFPGGKLVEGGIFAVNDEKQSNLYKVKDGRPLALFSKPAPAPESEGEGFSKKNPFAKQAEQEIRAKEIGSRKTDLDSAKTQLKAVEREIEILSNPPQESAASQRLGLPNYPASNISKAKKFEELSSKKKQLEQIIQTKRGFRRG
jgi:hypothetical protein